MITITPKINFLNKTVNVSYVSKPSSISFKGQTCDVFIKENEDKYQIDARKTVQKLRYGELTKAHLDDILLKFQGIDRELAQEILIQSSPNLSYSNLITQLRYLKNRCKLDNIKLVKSSSFTDMIKYFSQRQNIRIFSHLNYPNKSCKYVDKFGIIDSIFSRELNEEEIETLSDLYHLCVIDLNNFELLPNFIDFAISDKKAQEKIENLIKIAKELSIENPNLSNKELINKAKKQTFEKNIRKINELRSKKGRSLVKIYSTKAKLSDYSEIEKSLNSASNMPFPPNMLAGDFLCDMLEFNFAEPKELMSALASDEFTYYSPKKVMESLKVLMEKLKKQLKIDGINFDECLFVYKDSKSEAFFGYLLEEMGEIKKEQRILYDDAIEYLNKNKNKNNCVVYVDDILGTGDTTERYFDKLKNCKKYCAHIVSCKQGRNYLKKYNVKQIFAKSSFDGSKSKNKFISFHTLPAMFGSLLGQYCYSSEIFFFSYPDTALDPYQEFAHRVLGIEKRKEYP